mmetsp:Transcript_8473/g.4596  ORF Transcript_8473/g.4596 Transcript_8473/m.4596 type:complete len:1364 (-) Transcript_8473:684-4775(-)
MSKIPFGQKRIRKNFGKIRKVVDIPDLIGMQRMSYNHFLQKDIQPEKRKNMGLQAVFKSVFPIKDYTGRASLEFVLYRIDEPKYSVTECIYSGMTYEISVYITVRIVVYDIDKDLSISNIRDIKEQEIYFGTVPMMTEKGTFIINGTERVIVSQLHRSSGVFFDYDRLKKHSSGKMIYTCRIIPVRGSWIDMEIDPKDIVYMRIDRRRKFLVTVLFKAIGYTIEDIIKYFYKTEKITFSNSSYFKEFNEELFKGQRASGDILNSTGEVTVKKGRLFTNRAINKIKAAGITQIFVDSEEIYDKFFAFTIHSPKTNEPIVKSNDPVDEDALSKLKDAGINEFELIFIDGVTASDSIRKTLLIDKVETKVDALIDIYRRLRPGNPATPEVAQEFIDYLFFRPSRYDLSGVGRIKMNHRLDIDTPINITTLRKEDILLTTKTLIALKDTQGVVDDIDHLGNRRIRAVGELMENQYRIGLVRMERAIKERMSLQEFDALMPQDLINPKPVSSVMKEFFGTSQLSQFMDQINPLAETTHKRRLSALGPGGLTRERAGFEVRDVHPSHYGRICPVETPEGPNIGLIVSLSTYARVNDFGFIETPYFTVKDSKISKEIRYLSAFEEKEHPIAQANAPVDKKGRYINPMVTARVAGEFMMIKSNDIELMDISPNQLVSVSAALIPFLENDDANRALMGSNMQRQAVPLLSCSAPFVGTGMEAVVAKDSYTSILAERDCEVVDVEASKVMVINKSDYKSDYKKDIKIYKLSKFSRSNQNTCINQRPIVKKGQIVKAGEVIADGPAIDNGELALGKNVVVAFMQWGGYNFEDSILVSESLVKNGTFTSIHVEEFEIIARATKLGVEEITRDIPNVSQDALKNLDGSGIIQLGAEVYPGDILVGKITPKGETQLSPEEKLLRAIFGEKAGEVKDTSLYVPPGVEGIVIDAKVFSRKSAEKDERMKVIDKAEIAVFKKDRDDKIMVIEQVAREHVEEILEGEVVASPLKKGEKVLIAAEDKIDKKILSDIPLAQFNNIVFKRAELKEQVDEVLEWYHKEYELCRENFEEQSRRYKEGGVLQPGILKVVKVYVAMKRKLSVGDKMAGRHGNKGVVSRILPQEDMPYFADGRPVDMVLNPLGVPSRMNVGQVLEVHLGRASKGLGDLFQKLVKENKLEELKIKMRQVFSDKSDKEMLDSLNDDELCRYVELYKEGVPLATPVFDRANEEEIKELLSEVGFSQTGQEILYDGRTGKPFDKRVTVGIMYMLKLHHLVDDKIHARSIGPYSLITQQPLGGKAQFGGQRLGEMEVWAIEAYGAAYSLQEFLTVKSDDMAGRTRMYEKIVKGQNVLEPGLPESFRVLTKELNGLGLDVELLKG